MAFNLPVQNFFSKTIEPSPWVRPADWPVITDAPNEVQFLMSDINDASCTINTVFSRTSGSQNIVIDWGDGTTNTITTTSSTNTFHQYTVGTGTPCSRGYTTFKVRVYFTGTGVSVLSSCRLYGVSVTNNVTNPYYNVGLLEVYYGDGTNSATSMNNYYLSNSAASNSNFSFLEYVKLPSTITFTSFSSAFADCSSLAVVVMPTSASNLTGVGTMFNNCVNLRSITFPSNATGITSFTNTFLGCLSLVSVTLPSSLNSATTFTNTFNNCVSLKNITIPSINNCTSFSNTFSTCYSLEWVRFTSLPTVAGLNLWSSTFSSCYNLQNVYFPATCSSIPSYDFGNAFSQCFNLKTIVFPSGFNPSSLTTTFGNCYALKRVVFQSGASNLTALTTAFQNCYNLTNVTLPSSASSLGVSLNNTFLNCYSIKSVTIPSTYLITNLGSCFSSCYSLTTLNWTPGAQNSLVNFSSAFNNCFLLKSVTLPTSMTALTTITSCFNNCRSITSIVLPSALNAVTSIANIFQNCTLLTSVTLPTSMTSCTAFDAMFSACSTIRTVTLPATVSSAATSFANTFNSCFALRTVTFPSAAQLSSVNAINGLFFGCVNLTTINNFDKIGSLTATPLVNGTNNSYMRSSSISFVMPFSQLIMFGSSASAKTPIQAIRLLNASAGQWTSAAPHINISYTDLSTSALVQLFNDIAAQGVVTAKTINITGATGVAGLTAADRLIITSKGWTIIG